MVFSWILLWTLSSNNLIKAELNQPLCSGLEELAVSAYMSLCCKHKMLLAKCFICMTSHAKFHFGAWGRWHRNLTPKISFKLNLSLYWWHPIWHLLFWPAERRWVTSGNAFWTKRLTRRGKHPQGAGGFANHLSHHSKRCVKIDFLGCQSHLFSFLNKYSPTLPQKEYMCCNASAQLRLGIPTLPDDVSQPYSSRTCVSLPT